MTELLLYDAYDIYELLLLLRFASSRGAYESCRMRPSVIIWIELLVMESTDRFKPRWLSAAHSYLRLFHLLRPWAYWY